MREIIRGVIVAFVALALLGGCLLLIAGVGFWRIKRDGAGAPQQAVRATGDAQTRSSGVTSASTASDRPGPQAAPSVNVATRPAPRPDDRAAAVVAPNRPAVERRSQAASATLLTVDNQCGGNWVGRYGTQGFMLAAAGAAPQLPPGVRAKVLRGTYYTWSSPTTDPRAPTLPAAEAGRRVAGQWFAGDSVLLDIDLRDGHQPYDVALYLLDWDSDSRVQRLDVTDAASGAVLMSRVDRSFRPGRYVVLRLTGHVQLRFTHLDGANSTLSGVFFDHPRGVEP